MFSIYETTHGRREVIAFSTFAEACDYAKANYAIAFFDDDPDFPGAAADFMIKSGAIFAIEPRR